MEGPQPPAKPDPKDIPRSIGGFTWFILKQIFVRKRWVLFPLWVLLGLIALLILIGGGSAILPAIYIAL
jgi:hypothetical protein